MASVKTTEIGDQPKQLYKTRGKTTQGSLWPTNANKNGLFSDSKASKVGDIVTITISETSTASKAAATKTSKEATQEISMARIFGLGSSLGINNFLGSGNAFDPRLSASNANSFSGSGSTTRTDNLTATMTAVIKEVLSSGNFVIEGSRVVNVNNERQTIVLTGVIRPVDIEYNNIISSSLIANAEINYSGSGVISDKQRVGWGTRILDYVWPF